LSHKSKKPLDARRGLTFSLHGLRSLWWEVRIPLILPHPGLEGISPLPPQIEILDLHVDVRLAIASDLAPNAETE
jgi:hypothetical protein